MKRLAILIALASSTISGPIYAEESAKTCAAKSTDSERLACYDAIFRKPEVPASEANKEKEAKFNEVLKDRLSTGSWQVSESKSKIDDSPTVILRATSIATATDRYGQQKPLYMILRCSEGVTSAYINFADHFMADLNGGGKVDYRVDDKKARSKNFEESNDHEVLGLWSGGSSIPWIKELLGAKTLFVRATPYSSSEVSGEFSVLGLEQAIKPLRVACKW